MEGRLNVAVTGAGYGFVYVMSYPGSQMVKIGHSLDPTTRAMDIGGTLAPEEPVVEAYFWCTERRQDVERQAHRIRASVRQHGEWFQLDVPAGCGDDRTGCCYGCGRDQAGLLEGTCRT